MTDGRERRSEALVEATGENTKSKAIDTAAKHDVQMAAAADELAWQSTGGSMRKG